MSQFARKKICIHVNDRNLPRSPKLRQNLRRVGQSVHAHRPVSDEARAGAGADDLRDGPGAAEPHAVLEADRHGGRAYGRHSSGARRRRSFARGGRRTSEKATARGALHSGPGDVRPAAGGGVLRRAAATCGEQALDPRQTDVWVQQQAAHGLCGVQVARLSRGRAVAQRGGSRQGGAHALHAARPHLHQTGTGPLYPDRPDSRGACSSLTVYI